MKKKYVLHDFLPLIGLSFLIFCAVIVHLMIWGWDKNDLMRLSMGYFFIVFGFFKLINLKAFVEAYSIYDLLAARFSWYGYLYPFIEVGLGLLFLFSFQLKLAYWITLIIMSIGSVGVTLELQKGRQIPCACLGMVFILPMTYVSLGEDLLMAFMALAALLWG